MDAIRYGLGSIVAVSDDTALPDDTKIGYDTKVFKKLVDFVTELEPDQLTTEQNGKIADIISLFNIGHKDSPIKEDDNTKNKLIQACFPTINKFHDKYKDILDKEK